MLLFSNFSFGNNCLFLNRCRWLFWYIPWNKLLTMLLINFSQEINLRNFVSLCGLQLLNKCHLLGFELFRQFVNFIRFHDHLTNSFSIATLSVLITSIVFRFHFGFGVCPFFFHCNVWVLICFQKCFSVSKNFFLALHALTFSLWKLLIICGENLQMIFGNLFLANVPVSIENFSISIFLVFLFTS